MNIRLYMLMAVMLIGCHNNNEGVLAPAIEDNTIDLSKEIPGSWEKVCILSPYTSEEQAYEILGFKSDVAEQSGISLNDSFALLVAVKGDSIHRSYEISRGYVDFSGLGGACYKKGETSFKIIEGELHHVPGA